MTRARRISYSVDRDGRYVGATRETLVLLGYSEAEFLGSPAGMVTGQPAELARTLWRRFHAGEFQPPVGDPSRLHTKDGSVIAARFEGIERTGDSWTLTYRVLAGGAVALTRPRAVAEILRSWRAAEARVDGMAPEHPDRPAAEADAADWADLYQAAVAWQDRDR